MVTCYLEYVIDPYKLADFEAYARLWIPLVNGMGGVHHGYFLPHEGANNLAYALFSFPTLADYEAYRALLKSDPEGAANFRMAKDKRMILAEERTFLRQVE